ncbi:ABC transporter ATP-binding protein [Rhizobium wenxiniae]|uniref:ABC transporter ATP-binding protein n=1 Tax=Rhizobium wenxiniae TaxID=1737357 RepID=UPI003C15B3AE
MTGVALLSGEGICFGASDGTRILHDISLRVGAGDRLAIVGPNGAGKTSLLQILAGLVFPNAGHVEIGGSNLADLHPAERARTIAVVGQSDQPDRRLTLYDYVALGRIPHSGRLARRIDRDLIQDAIERTGLSRLITRGMGSLSGGERQRAHIARALVQQPRILFLDEPTNHLDPRARGDLLGLIARLGLTVIAVLHDLHLVPSFATHVAILRRGELVAHGVPDRALSPGTVREVFGIDLLRFQHPDEDREITVFDIPFNANIGVLGS